MPTPDPSNVLFKIAHPDLYERNPFNVLNLPVDATAKDIRRRKEDIEAAFDARTEAAEFANILPGDETRKTPTRAEIDELFATLENPEKRIAYALFWFWQGPQEAKPRNPNRSIAGFLSMFEGNLEEAMRADGIPTPLLGRHNLAVFHHMKAMAAEKSLLGKAVQTAVDPAVANQLSSHWKSAISGWNALANDPDAWHAVSDLVTALGDPRVDYRFARALRDQFAFAFDQINVELAIDFAKTGREADAKRQVEYMKLSQPDSDDVEGTFDDAFAGLLRQTEAIVKTARDEAQRNPKDGLKKANEILSGSNESIRVSRVILEKESPIRKAIVSTVFTGVRSCLISYGNETLDWENCLAIAKRLASLAETEDQARKAKEDFDTLTKFATEKKLHETCWRCKAKIDQTNGRPFTEVKLWGRMQFGASVGQVRFRTLIIRVPTCQRCKIHEIDARDFPEVRKALDEGWKIGDGPSQDEIAQFWGMPTSSDRFSPSSSNSDSDRGSKLGCLIGFVFLLFVVASVLGDSSSKRSSGGGSSPPRTTSSPANNSATLAEQEQKTREEKQLWESRKQTPPSNGTTRRYHQETANAPLKVSTSSGSNYFVKIVDSTTGFVVLDLFVKGGLSAEIDVPPGIYEMRYASGKDWYGYEYLFGPETVYSKADHQFSFSNGNGYEVTLYKVLNGNLSTRSIRPEDF